MSKYVDAIIGHAIGDAMGVPTEFCDREKLLANPVTKMISSPKVGEPAGSFSDDTSMEIATIDSFIEKGKFDYADIMQKWSNWIDNGDYTPNGNIFDVGRTCLTAIRKFCDGVNPIECGLDGVNSNGNGSLMRILPVALYSYTKRFNDSEIINLVNDISSLTHSHDISKLGCYIYVKYVIYLLEGYSKEEAYEKIQQNDYSSYSKEAIAVYDRILKNNIKKYPLNKINSSGYIVDTLECALWILLNAKSYKEAIISSTNIGQDTDTIGAVLGSMAGIIYGIDSIPKSWLKKLIKRDYLMELALKFEHMTTTYKKDPVLGAVIGDIAGSRFEMFSNRDGKVFELLHKLGKYTDDSVMTLAIAKAFLDSKKDYRDIKEKATKSMIELGRKYPNRGYGPSFYKWIMSEDHLPYKSFGNGAAMRISPVGVVLSNIDDIKEISKIITCVSHNHPDSVIGATVVSIVIRMALNGDDKETIKKYVEENYFIINNLNNDSRFFNINCVETVKQSLMAFLDSYDFEDTIRNAISYGGDSDTIGAIAGSMAAAYYGIPEDLCNKALSYLDDYLIEIHDNFYEKYCNKKIDV